MRAFAVVVVVLIQFHFLLCYFCHTFALLCINKYSWRILIEKLPFSSNGYFLISTTDSFSCVVFMTKKKSKYKNEIMPFIIHRDGTTANGERKSFWNSKDTQVSAKNREKKNGWNNDVFFFFFSNKKSDRTIASWRRTKWRTMLIRQSTRANLFPLSYSLFMQK